MGHLAASINRIEQQEAADRRFDKTFAEFSFASGPAVLARIWPRNGPDSRWVRETGTEAETQTETESATVTVTESV